MARKAYRYYGIRGSGYVHAECWQDYRIQKSRYDAQGRCHWSPSIISQLVTFRGIRKERCEHCNRPLLAKPPQAEQAA